MNARTFVRKAAFRALHWADRGAQYREPTELLPILVRVSGRFDGKVALVTGAGSGLGRATALRLAQEGASVVVAGRRESLLDEVRQEIMTSGGAASTISCDVSNAPDCENAVKAAISHFGKLDVLVNCAGTNLGSETVVETDEACWNEVMNVNLKGSYLVAKYAIAEMRKQNGGAVVNVSSICGMRGSDHGVAYGTSKGGVVNLTRYMAISHAGEGIRVNCVCPGVYKTPATEQWLSSTRALAEVSSWHPLGRIGHVEEVASAVVFLASEEASFITGVILPVDGGHLAGGIGNP